MLNQSHVDLISRVRELLQKLEHETLMETRYPHGRFGEACRAADDALYHVVLIARHWLDANVEEKKGSDTS